MSRLDKHPERRSKAASLFDVDTNEVDSGNHTNTEDNADQLVKQLDRLTQKELRTWWDYTTLNSYLDKKLIPRGLRIKKIATTIYPEPFQNEWNSILTKCSVDLMKLIVQYEQKSLDEMETEIKTLQDTISKLAPPGKMEEITKQIDTNILKLEENIMILKRRKFQRDVQDYIKGEVYTWTTNKPKSILKSNRGWNNNRNRSYSNSRVKFPSLNTSAEVSCVSSDDQSEAGGNTPQEWIKAQGAIPKVPPTKQGKRKSSKNEAGEPAGNTGEVRYPQRRRNKKT